MEDREPQSEPSAHKMYQNAQELVDKGNRKRARKALEEMVATYPDYAAAHNDLGALCAAEGDENKALFHYEKATTLQPKNQIFQKNLAGFFLRKPDGTQKAIQVYLRVLETNPTDVETLVVLGHICLSMDNQADAKFFFEKILKIEPWNADARDGLGQIEKEQSIGALYTETFLSSGMYAGVYDIDFGLKKDDKVVDIGGGINPYPKANYVIDMVGQECQRHGRPINVGNRVFLNGDVREVLSSLPDDFFDFCWSSHTFEHIDDLPSALEMISAKCKRGFFALPASDFEFLTAKSHHGHVNLCRLIGGVLHICKRPPVSISDHLAVLFEKHLFNNPEFNKVWEGHNCKGLRFIWEARHYWEGKIEYKFHHDPLELYPQLEYFKE